MPETKFDNPFALQLVDVDKADVLELSGVFLPMLKTAQAIADKAMSMVVTDECQTELISECHDMEMKLRKIRTDADKERLALGKSALRKKQAIDGHFKVIRFCTEPAEEHLREQKNFVKLAKEKRLAELSESRIEQLSEFEVDTEPSFWQRQCEFYNLAEMSEGGFQQLLETVKFQHERKLADQKKEEEELVARAAAEVKRQKEMEAENERLVAEIKKEQQEREKMEAKREEEANKQRVLGAKVLAKVEEKMAKERQAKQEAEKKLAEERKEWQEAEQLQAELEQQKLERIKAARLAPDKKKLEKLAVIIAAIEMPEVTSKEAKSIIEVTIELLNKASNYIKTKSLNL